MPTRVVYENVESRSVGVMAQTNGFFKDGTNDMAKVVTLGRDSVAAHGGSKCIECNWDGVVAYPDPLGLCTVGLDFPYTSEFFMRYWFRADADCDATDGSKSFRLDNGGSPGVDLNSFYWNSRFQDGSGLTKGQFYCQIEYIDGGGVFDEVFSGIPIGNGLWHKIEIYNKTAGSGGSIFRVWVDGTQVFNKTGYSSTTANKWTSAYFNSNWSSNPGWEHDANNHTYYDDIEVFSDDAGGTATTGLMSDASIQVVGGGGGGGGGGPAMRNPIALHSSNSF